MICNICPRGCNIDREKNIGFCQMPKQPKIALCQLFFYEEPCITGNNGSGAVFFSGCSLKCVFCQNYEISSLANGKQISVLELANIFRELEQKGAENINLVNPTHYVDAIEKALEIYRPNIPIVYNTHGYEREETIERVAKFVDVFLPDFKYINNEYAKKYSGALNYVETCQNALLKMRQQKPQDVYVDGKLVSGVLVRHLVLPLMANDSIKILEWISQNLPNTKVSVMAQYTPCGDANKYPEINRKITKREYDKVVEAFIDLGLDGYVQERESSSTEFIPKWDY